MGIDYLILGADGMDPRLLDYMCSKGYVPTIDNLIEEGADVGRMASRVGSQSVPHTGPAWTTIYTGLTEREHGVTQGAGYWAMSR
jgi:predicted AlkP superfamily phosphohydrolase/phosphomutase